MKIFQVTGLLFQLLGTWFLCRVFYKVRSLELGQTESGGPVSGTGNGTVVVQDRRDSALARGLP